MTESLAPRTVLVVEDNEDDVFALKRAFRKANLPLPLQVVTDGQQALDYMSGAGRFRDRDAFPLPSLIFLDLKLPFFTGHEILRRIRPSFPSLPVYILSGSDESRDREEAQANGANGYLVKPISAEVLVAILQGEPAFADLFEDRS